MAAPKVPLVAKAGLVLPTDRLIQELRNLVQALAERALLSVEKVIAMAATAAEQGEKQPEKEEEAPEPVVARERPERAGVERPVRRWSAAGTRTR
ncbi:hypothetical protein [Acrocarpospora catenulata]|uniref:hypothetical protein n=1 Tax=Acrocarpospora catenulata TaxID=2836182 RepID=UPI001BD9E91B|nr:hypothetical protein [Acrocarpospora catenulata]